jgi:GNAT superfamily N-acetyltransferase
MDSPMEVRESHEQFRAAWTLYSRCSGSGEVVELDGLCIANSRHPWYLMNAAVPTEPVSSLAQLEVLAGAAKDYYANERRPWFFVGGQQWLGEDAAETLSRVGLAKAFSVTGMVTEQLAPPTRPLPEVETRRIDDGASQRELADLNAAVYNVTPEWVRSAVVLEALWRTPLYGYNAYVDGQPVSTAFTVPLDGVLYVAYVATAPAFRHRGLAELVMRRSLENATRETGITRTALHATADGFPGYLRMGYRSVDTFTLYLPQ